MKPTLPVPFPLPQTPGLEGALADMLLAWYQSGYATGRYYTMLEQQQQQYQMYYAQQPYDPSSGGVHDTGGATAEQHSKC
jgi:hypothetical protein